MTDVALVHLDLMAKGGGEAVAVNVAEALQDEHDLTLFTLTDPDVDELREYFDVDLRESALTVRTAGRLAPALYERYGPRYYVLENALLSRYVRRRTDEFDVVISTINELGLGPDAIEYVHFPFDWNVTLPDREHLFHRSVEDRSLYQRLCTAVADVSREDLKSSLVLANSEWTAGKVAEAYGTRPEVVYPPIDTEAFTDRPWDARENGFVTVGRIEPSKRTVELIETVDAVRERGHDVHLHVVGPPVDDAYARRVAALAAGRPHVHLEGEVPRGELIELICSHRYGIHGKAFEHFGMAVAELAAGGTVPFVPSSGGQRAIVRDRHELLFDSPEAAVAKIDRVLSDPTLQRELRTSTAEIDRRFGRGRFQETVTDAVDAAVDGNPGGSTRSVRSTSTSSPTDD